MLKKAILLAALLLQVGLLSVVPLNADEAPAPWCFPCVR